MCPDRRAIPLRNNLLRTISGQPATESHTNDLSYGKTDCVSLPHRRDLASWKHQSTIQYTFAIQQPRPQHLPRGLAQRIFSQPPRLSTSRLPLPHGSPRRSAKNALLCGNQRRAMRPRKAGPGKVANIANNRGFPGKLRAAASCFQSVVAWS